MRDVQLSPGLRVCRAMAWRMNSRDPASCTITAPHRRRTRAPSTTHTLTALPVAPEPPKHTLPTTPTQEINMTDKERDDHYEIEPYVQRRLDRDARRRDYL